MARLDHALPGWVEAAAELIVESAPRGLEERLQRLCVLLGSRQLRRPEPLLQALEDCPAESRVWLLAALSGTDITLVRAAWLDCLRKWAAFEDCGQSAATWFAFLRAFLGGWLTWVDFRECLLRGPVLAAAGHHGDYRPALERLGLSPHPLFAKWYRQVIYEVAHQPDARFLLASGGWIRDFPSSEYLLAALDDLERQPDSWWPLHVLRWASVADLSDEELQRELKQHSDLVLCLLSLVCPDLSHAVGVALNAPHHEEAIWWLRTAGPQAPLDLTWVNNVISPWVASLGESVTLAAGALCSVEPPADFLGPEQSAAKTRAFLRAHLFPEFDCVMDNLLYVHALRKCYFEVIYEQARHGMPNALRALALWPEQSEAAAPLLFRLSREGKNAVRQAADWSLGVLRERSGVDDLSHLEKRVDLASAWADSGLEGRSARAWWDVAGYHVRLSVEAGKLNLAVYSKARRLASLPAAVRKDPQYEDIRRTRAHLSQSYRYFRRRFEQMMADGVRYPGRDFTTLLANPVVRSLAHRLVLLVDDAPILWSPDDPLDSCSPPQQLSIARSVAIPHPVELSSRGELESWQQRVIEDRIAQPFKQVFREIYFVGEAEGAANASTRFSGHRLDARRAFALLRNRGYTPREGDAVKEWSAQHIRAHIEWAAPDEDVGKQLGVDNAQPVTTQAVWFEAGSGERLPLAMAPSAVFSETMRDADLLVSRATAGELGFSSEETRRLRATLVRYLARALGLTCIYVSEDDTYAIVEGKRAMYRVHLGSGSALLEKSRRALDLGSLRSELMEALISESMDSSTARILGIIGALSLDEQLTDPWFLNQLGDQSPGLS